MEQTAVKLSEPVQIIYEKGITTRKIGTEWHLLNVDGMGTISVKKPEIDFGNFGTLVDLTTYGVSPIVMTTRYFRRDGSSHDSDSLLLKAPHTIYRAYITSIEQATLKQVIAMAVDVRLLREKVFDITYLLKSVEYHCIQLCKHYASICELYYEVRCISDGPPL